MATPSSGSRLLFHAQVKRAFGDDPDHPARPATVVGVDEHVAELRFLDGSHTDVAVHDAELLHRILAREDLCRLGEQPLCLVNESYGVLGIATGPAVPPTRLEVLWVSQLGDDGGVVELLGNGDQPGWQILALAEPS